MRSSSLQRSVPTDEICDRLATGREWFLCLIDNAVLEPSRFQSMVDITGEVSYAGHFVLLTEYSFRDNRIIAIDPARDVDKCAWSRMLAAPLTLRSPPYPPDLSCCCCCLRCM